MKRFLCKLLAGLMVVMSMGVGTSFAENIDKDSSIPTEGIVAEGDIGYGLFNLNGGMPFAEHGISDNNLRIQYDKSNDRILYSYYTLATDTSSEIGMLPLQLQMWDPSSSKWVSVSAGSPLSYNTYSSSNSYVKYSPTHGRYYRVNGYHYAKINGQNHLLYNETSSVWVN